MNREIIVICGPTAVGKTKYAIETALHMDGEVVSCDSMQLYKYMDIGSAKPTAEERRRVKHYLVDEIEPTEAFSAARYQKLAKGAIEEIFAKGKTPVIAGGTGLYLSALLYDMDFSAPPGDTAFRDSLYKEAETYGPAWLHKKLEEADPEAAKRIHPNNIKKVVRAIEAASLGEKVKDFASDLKLTSDYSARLIGLARDRQQLYDRINQRVDLLMEQGLCDEVKGLMERGLTESDISMKGIGYKEIIGYLEGRYDLAEAVDLVKKNTRHYAKRQLTWFKRYKDMQWFNISEYDSDESCLEEIFKWLEKK
ncbi:tRNA (adenosine(37)-N6)-dimethylallyltransferase MiaA [Anaerovoracaceae bacterium 41-7]|jgi:tRNA dimethylallyltransferase|uniref:tRNA (adenosine(37)-N6)-dimethylallyltransferase MiaA n=1 Tax=Emergencia sp. JLR.KK010 TaxID=3114296 RepID=UPI00203CAF39|nr:tRNA (adenosine(37)-N6)-dimethylallyltransferase MiaA [Emergencia sp.]MCI9639341.1 tRNA (adenosine(37)-N6)-dimethylallyltransferase MiaA [Emergencia sp.]